MTMHSLYGLILAKYLERLHRSNDQLLKLSEMVGDALDKNAEINTDDLFESIEKNKKAKAK